MKSFITATRKIYSVHTSTDSKRWIINNEPRTHPQIIVSIWWNTVYRNIFGYHKWESVKEVICRLGRLDFPHLLNLRRSSFLQNMSLSGNFVFASIAMSNKCICEMLMLEHTSRVKLCWSLAKIKASTYALFKTTCGVEACV